MKTSKREIYKAYGIETENGKVNAPEFGWINPLLVDGNSKLGKGIYTWSTLPTNKEFKFIVNGKEYTERGTCVCHCDGCYATKGFYNMNSVIIANGIKTYLVRHYPEFVKNAIKAQIKADNIKFVRIHASGDFFSAEYVEMWQDIVAECNDTIFWTYTKNTQAENAFDNYSNCNIVKSCIHGIGFNFGHCDYILNTYNKLKSENKAVYICRCGIDKNQHCTNCRGCSKNEYVLFVEHSTSYKAELDASYETLKAVIDSQEKM